MRPCSPRSAASSPPARCAARGPSPWLGVGFRERRRLRRRRRAYRAHARALLFSGDGELVPSPFFFLWLLVSTPQRQPICSFLPVHLDSIHESKTLVFPTELFKSYERPSCGCGVASYTSLIRSNIYRCWLRPSQSLSLSEIFLSVGTRTQRAF
jgi:hypothetical protein